MPNQTPYNPNASDWWSQLVTCPACFTPHLRYRKTCPVCNRETTYNIPTEVSKYMESQDKWISSERVYFNPIQKETTVTTETSSSPLDTMVGGTHYQNGGIQPVEFIESNNIGFAKGNIIKYAYRHENKNGLQDLLKVVHYTLLEAHFKYPKEDVAKFKDDVKNLLG